MNRKDLTGLQYVSKEEIREILDTAKSMKEIGTRQIKKVPALRGKTVVNLFFEPSTRTRSSFDLAAKRLSADVINLAMSSSSTTKGESLYDTLKTMEAMNPDFFIIRHSSVGSADFIAKYTYASVLNAGDGAHEHPTQALLDMLTIEEKLGKIEGINIAIVGDIANSRVARSNIYGLTTMGANVTLVGPPTMIPCEVEKLGVKVCYNIDEIIGKLDVIMLLRIQMERLGEVLFPSLREYANYFGINSQKLEKAKKDIVIMHPGPINRGVEISEDVADSKNSVILDQVTNGIAVRMACLYLLNNENKSAGEQGNKSLI
ncbi:MAG: aspartate carbamoyltransferase catalytic subunit [Pseudomonadota bacterium]